MKHVSLSSGLSELREILKAAIHHCNTIPDAPAEIRSAVADHSLSCIGIEGVIELVVKSKNSAISAGHNYRLLEQHLHAAKTARRNIRNATAKYHHGGLGFRPGVSTTRYQELTVCLLSNLSRIVTALNSAILLVSIRLNSDRARMLIERLRSLVASCQVADGSSQKLTHVSVSSSSKPQGEPHENDHTEVQELLQPFNVAYVLSELHAVRAHAEASAFGVTVPPRNTQLLNINLLSLLLERQPSHPPHVFPTIVSYYSDIVLATRAGDHTRLSQIVNNFPELLYCFTIDNLTLMSFAIESGEIKTVQYLLRRGIGVNDTYGRSNTCPLATALQFRHLHIARLLVHTGADFEHKNKYGWSPLFYVWFKEDRVLSAGPLLGLLAASTSFHVMHRDVYDKDGWSVMHRAAIYGTPQDVSTLVQLGVDPFCVTRTKDKNPTDDNIHNYNVLQQVVLDGLADMVEVLLPVYREKLGNVDLADERGWTLLHMAIQEQRLPIVRMLVENGADLWAKTKPTWIARVSDTNVRRYTPFSLAKSFGPSFFQCFIRVVQRYQQGLRSANAEDVSKRPYDSEISVLPSSHLAPASVNERVRISCRSALPVSKKLGSGTSHGKNFRGTTVSGNASAHMGDSIRHYRITHYNFEGTCSKAKLKRIKFCEKLSHQAQHDARKKALGAQHRSVHRGKV